MLEKIQQFLHQLIFITICDITHSSKSGALVAMPTLNGACRAYNVSLGALPGKLMVKDKSGRSWKNFWFGLN